MILIGIPHTGQIRIELAKWLFDIARKHKNVELFFRYQQPVDINRNEICHYFLEQTKHKWLLMLDSDQIPKTDLTNMIKHNKKVVSGLTTIMFKGVPMPLVMKKAKGTKEILWQRITLQDLKERGNEKTGLIKVDGVGTGVLLIRRDVLKKMKQPWFNFLMNKDGTLKRSEDYNFCHKLNKMGVQMYLDSNARAGHAKNIDLFELNKVMGKLVQTLGVKTETFKKVRRNK